MRTATEPEPTLSNRYKHFHFNVIRPPGPFEYAYPLLLDTSQMPGSTGLRASLLDTKVTQRNVALIYKANVSS